MNNNAITTIDYTAIININDNDINNDKWDDKGKTDDNNYNNDNSV